MYLDHILRIAFEERDFNKVKYVLSLGGLVDPVHVANNIAHFTMDDIKFIFTKYPKLFGEYGELITRLLDRGVDQNIVNLVYNIYRKTNNNLDLLLHILVNGRHYRNEVTKRILFHDISCIKSETLSNLLCNCVHNGRQFIVDTVNNEYDMFIYIVNNFQNKTCKLILKYTTIPKDVIEYGIKPYLDCGIVPDY